MLNQPLTSFPHLIERQASTASANIVLPAVNSDNFSFRLSSFPVEGAETILDIHSIGSRIYITVTRFLFSIRSNILDKGLDKNIISKTSPIEISIAECSMAEPIIRELLSDDVFDLKNDLTNQINDNHYFLFFTDSRNCIFAGISNPHSSNQEKWIRLINRSYASILVPPQRIRKSLLSHNEV